MKKGLLFVVLGLLLVSARAQYLDFPATGAVWTVQTAYSNGNPPSDTYRYYYYNNGDTLMNGKNYYRISGRVENWFPLNPGDYWIYQMPDRFIRTDTIAGKAYWLNDTADELVYDYTLQVGDTLTNCPHVIDSIFTLNLFGTTRRVFRYNSFQAPTGYIIEGIGSTDGLFITKSYEQYSCFEWSSRLTCFSYNNQTIGYNLITGAGTCPIPNVGSTDTSCHAGFHILPDSSNAGVYNGYNQSIGQYLSYLWLFGDGDSSTAQYPSHTYALPGQYYVCLSVRSIYGCTNTYCDSSFLVFKIEGGLMSQLNILNPNGISEITMSPFSLSPNPATSTVTITVDESMIGSTVTITDVTGRKVASVLLSTVNRQLSIDNFANGIYLVTITGTGGRSATKKLVINK